MKSLESDSPSGEEAPALPRLLLPAALGMGCYITAQRAAAHGVHHGGGPRTGQGGGPTPPGSPAAQGAAQPHPPVRPLTWGLRHSRVQGSALQQTLCPHQCGKGKGS